MSNKSIQRIVRDEKLGKSFLIWACCCAVWTHFSSLTTAAERKVSATELAEHHRFFELKVRPLLAERCYQCHSGKEQKGDLRVDYLAGLLKGGESGDPAIVPFKPEESLLVEAIHWDGYEMPPDNKMSPEEIAILETWVKSGAHWPNAEEENKKAQASSGISEEDRKWWAYQPIKKIELEQNEQHPVDQLVALTLSQKGLTPAPAADRRTLIRRLYFDVTGLPPTPEEISEFENDSDPQAYEKLVDRLLASPHYGEHWARHWLDVVRYAESDGWRKDDYRPDAWRYREYVVNALNQDKPYNQFVREHLAGDEIAPDNPEVLAATGFLRLGIYEYNQRDARTQWKDIVNEMTDVTSDVFLGAGLACARCHHHKFDPILQTDYFKLRSFFEPLIWREDVPYATVEKRKEYQKQLAAWEAKTKLIREQLDQIEKPYRDKHTKSAVVMFPLDVQEAYYKAPEQRTSADEQMHYLVWRQVQDKLKTINWKNLKGEKKENWNRLQQELKKHLAEKPKPLPGLIMVSDAPGEVVPTRIPDKRNSPEFAPGFLEVLGGETADVKQPVNLPHSTGRRTALADWIVSEENPLTTRVIVNRIWQYHFGEGIVSTPNDFGKLGTIPSHPELLDWLSATFIEQGWSLKKLHRLILTSNTYRQSYEHPQSAAFEQIDPENRYLWRANIRRLTAEQLRDAMLAMTGELDRTLGGPGIRKEHQRRSLYSRVMRNKHVAMLGTMGAPDGIKSAPVRYIATTAPQALLLMNGKYALERAEKLQQRLSKQIDAHVSSHQLEEFITQAFLITTGTHPSKEQREQAVSYIMSELPDTAIPETMKLSDIPATALTDFCHILFNSNQFIYVD